MPHKSIFVIFVYLGIISVSFANSIPFHVVDDNGKEIAVIYPVIQRQNYYISVEELFAILDHNGKQQYIAINQHLTLNIKEKRFDLNINQNSVVINREENFVLSNSPILIDRKPMIPIEFVTELASRVFGFKAKFNKTAQRIQIFKKKESKIEETEYPLESTEFFLFVIDPGHGGTDTGVKIRSDLIEKNLTLQLSKRLEMLCKRNQTKVLLTRSSDKSLFPKERVDIANKNGGDLFISIHFNASFSPKPSGFRIYVNKSLSPLSDGFSKLSQQIEEEAPKIKRFSQSEFLEQSQNLAQLIKVELESINLTGKIVNAPIVILRQLYMPAVLIELGYLSNFSDEAIFSDPDMLNEVANALFKVVQKFSQQ